MKAPTWEKCHYYSNGLCPQHTAIDRAYLIPQLLEVHHIEAAIKLCEQCEKYHYEKRKFQRIKRPLKVTIANQEKRRRSAGTLVDVSVEGALVKLDHWIDFGKNELVQVQLSSATMDSNQVKADLMNLSGRIRRLARDKQELAIVFL